MAEVLCPRCGKRTLGTTGFWQTSKPYCSFCGWNLDIVQQQARDSVWPASWSLSLLGLLFGVFAYFTNATRIIVPVILVSVAFLFFPIMSWRRLRHLEDVRPAAPQRTQLVFVRKAEEETQAKNAQRYEAERNFLQIAPKPRAVQFKASARIFSVAFPASWIIFGCWAYQITRAPLTVKKWSEDVAPFLFCAVIWSFICISTISKARQR
jgi:uncharacterized protein (DUF983 family)